METTLRDFLHPVPDFPKQGVLYWDTTPLLSSPVLFREAVETLAGHARDTRATCIVAIEAKGFPLGGAVACAASLPLFLIRKPGLTPGAVHEVSFEKEYGKGAYQLKADGLKVHERAFLLYDILAGPGASKAALKLVRSTGAAVAGAGYIVELQYLGGREALEPLPVYALLQVSERIAHGNTITQL